MFSLRLTTPPRTDHINLTIFSRSANLHTAESASHTSHNYAVKNYANTPESPEIDDTKTYRKNPLSNHKDMVISSEDLSIVSDQNADASVLPENERQSITTVSKNFNFLASIFINISDNSLSGSNSRNPPVCVTVMRNDNIADLVLFTVNNNLGNGIHLFSTRLEAPKSAKPALENKSSIID